MSRVGKKPILIPEGVQVKIEEGNRVFVKGPKGELFRSFPDFVKISPEDNQVSLSLVDEKKENKVFWGTSRAILNNMIKGVKEGFEKRMQIEGLGYKAVLSGNDLELFVGFSHSVKMAAPDGVKFSLEKNIIVVSGIDLEKVSLTAAQIKKIKKPEPYKGAGIRYQGEQIRRKVGKKATTTTK